MKKILANPILRRELVVSSIIAIQAREGITTTRAQAERAYDRIHQALDEDDDDLSDRWDKAIVFLSPSNREKGWEYGLSSSG